MQMQRLAALIGFRAWGIDKDMALPLPPLLLTDVVTSHCDFVKNRSVVAGLPQNFRLYAAGKFQHQEAEHNLG